MYLCTAVHQISSPAPTANPRTPAQNNKAMPATIEAVGYGKKSAGRMARLPIISTEGRRGTLHWKFMVQAMRVDWGNVQRMKRRKGGQNADVVLRKDFLTQSIKMFRGGKVHRAYSVGCFVFASVLLQFSLHSRLEEYAASPKEPDRRPGNNFTRAHR